MRRIPRHGYGMHVPAALFSYSCDGNGHGVGGRDHGDHGSRCVPRCRECRSMG
jgi:hypothetical protein